MVRCYMIKIFRIEFVKEKFYNDIIVDSVRLFYYYINLMIIKG